MTRLPRSIPGIEPTRQYESPGVIPSQLMPVGPVLNFEVPTDRTERFSLIEV
ncbi:MAG: hypothetical protein AAFW95_04415 [Cyanobacteria bacterium J06638_6]